MRIRPYLHCAGRLSLLPLICLSLRAAHAGSATWKSDPVNRSWNDPDNWTPSTVPNGPFDVATFSGPTNTPNILISDSSAILLHTLNVDSSAPHIIVGITGNSNLTFDGNGVTGGFGGALLTETGGSITFTKRAVCGISVTIFGGRVDFFDRSSLQGMINTGGGDVAFFDHTSVGLNDGRGSDIILNGDAVFFNDDSSALALFLTLAGVNGDAVLDLSGHNRPGLRLLNLNGSGFVFLGANKLTLVNGGSSAVIQDGGESGGVGGSLTKVGSDNDLTLSGASTYTGGTNVNDGKLIVDNQSGSGTGTGAVRVNLGSLGGGGIIAGPVTVGTGRGVAILAPAHGLGEPLTLTILNQVTFNADGNYSFTFRKEREEQFSDQVIAEGVTINEAMFSATGQSDGPLILGSVFTAISNTSADPISGSFNNLPDGTIITVNGNNLQASYTGGDGNDLTLTVVP